MKSLFCFGLASVLALSACKKNETVLTIGEFASLTGTTATFVQSMNDGIQLALEEVNQAGGLRGNQVEVIDEDGHSKPEEAKTAVVTQVKQNQVKALLGEVAASGSLAAAPEA